MLKLIDKIPENIPEKRIKRFSAKYTLSNAIMFVAPPQERIGRRIQHWMVFEDILEKCYNIKKSFKFDFTGGLSIVKGDISKINQFYYIEEYPFFIPKNWIDGKKEIFIYCDEKDIYFHIELQRYLEVVYPDSLYSIEDD